MRTLSNPEDEQADSFLSLLAKKIAGRGKVVVITGAGISVSSGIPDFRSTGGLYETTIKDSSEREILKGKDLFDISSLLNPKTRPYFFKFISELKLGCDQAEPSPTHCFIKRLGDLGMLLRTYTQNIDDLERKVGMAVFDGQVESVVVENVGLKRRESLGGSAASRPTVIPLHGSLQHLVCTVCRHRRQFDLSAISSFGQGNMIECQQCRVRSDEREQRGRRRLHSGIYRPNIVLYNEHHPMGDVISEFVRLDLDMMPTTVLVMGTSLRIPGLKRLVKDMAKSVQQKRQSCEERAGLVLYINKTPASRGEWRSIFDAELLGECDEWIGRLSNRMERMTIGNPRSIQMASPSSEQKKITSFFKTLPGKTSQLAGKKATGSKDGEAKGRRNPSRVDPMAAIKRCSILA